MNIANKLKLLEKIDQYYNDIKNLDEGCINKSKTYYKCMAIFSYIVYGTSFAEYFAYKFFKRTYKQKRTYMTRRYMFRFFDKYDPEEYRIRIADKSLTSQYYGKYMKREQFTYDMGYDAFVRFAKKYNKLFIKKAVGWGGEGASREIAKTQEQIEDIWKKLSNEVIVEPIIENKEEIKEFSPETLNTLKVVTLIVKNKPEIQYSILRMGNNSQVDNVHLGGIAAGVDVETGIIHTKAFDKHFNSYEYHPVSKKQILGFKIPMWDEVKKFVKEVANVTPECRYASWDIAITPDGIRLIEGNYDAEFYFEQFLYDRGVRKEFIRKLEA